ncbi:hypothetical protein RB195_004450 [Necator americanus]|uniref:Uncharacterized protein n=1 Tax=Necator americanus TaxID=51031 RepID=A0ABR1BLZ1_NECAM
MMKAMKIKYVVIGLTDKTRRRHPLNAVHETGEELFLGTHNSRGVVGVSVLVNKSIAKNIDSFEQLTTRIGRLRIRRCNTNFNYLRRLRSNINVRRRRSRSFLYGPGEVLPRRSCLLRGYNWRFQCQSWPKKNDEELHIGTLQLNEQRRGSPSSS